MDIKRSKLTKKFSTIGYEISNFDIIIYKSMWPSKASP